MDNPLRRLTFLPYCPFGLYDNINTIAVVLFETLYLYQQGAICVNQVQDSGFQLALLNLEFS